MTATMRPIVGPRVRADLLAAALAALRFVFALLVLGEPQNRRVRLAASVTDVMRFIRLHRLQGLHLHGDVVRMIAE